MQIISFEAMDLMLPARFRSAVCSLRLYIPFVSTTGKQQLALAPCGLIKLLQWLLSVSLIRSLAQTSGTSLVYSYRAEDSVVKAGSRGADRGADITRAEGELRWLHFAAIKPSKIWFSILWDRWGLFYSFTLHEHKRTKSATENHTNASKE